MRQRIGLWLVTLMLLGSVIPGPVAAADGSPAILGRGGRWLVEQQNADGGFGLPASSGGTTADVVLALVAAGVDPSTVRRDGLSPVDYLRTQVGTYGATAGGAAKIALAVAALGQDARQFGGSDLLATMKSSQSSDGRYGQSLFEHALAMLALRAHGEPVTVTARDYLLHSQISDGSWGFLGPGQPGEGDTNTTALALQALVAADAAAPAIVGRALDFLRRSQAADGGFAYAPAQGDPVVADANSTAVVVQALLALDQAPNGAAWGAALKRLTGFQNESGAFRWLDQQPEDNLFATLQALPAAAELYLPFGPSDARGPRVRRLAAQPVAAVASTPERQYFPETGHTLAYGFKYFWHANGGWPIFGLPLTEEFREINPADGQEYTVQYFERARFEYHPEHQGTPYEVQLGLLGQSATALWGHPAFGPAPDTAGAGCQHFGATGHSVCGPFLDYWTQGGGLPVFGFPLSECFTLDGKTIQYFERARFESNGNTIQLGLLGRETLYTPRLVDAR